MNTQSKTSKIALICLLLILSASLNLSQTDTKNPFRIQRLSDRVIALTENSPMENIVVAIASQKGLIVVDTLGSIPLAKKMREIIEKEFGRKDFAYVINTHHHWDHINGNQVFAGATVIGQDRCREIYYRAAKALAQSKEKQSREKEAPVLPSPVFTFSERMTLDLGDLTLKLIYFGRAHSGSDILIHVPEEGLLLTGDLFLERGWLPLFSGMAELDVPRWIEALNSVLDDKSQIKYVIPGHRDIWKQEKLVIWRDYIVNLWEGLVAAEAEGLKFEALKERFPLNQKFFYLRDLGHNENDIQRFHEKNISAFWGQLKESAAKIMEKEIEESGIETAIAKYHELKLHPEEGYFFDEYAFNSLGYRLLIQRKTKEAIEVFKLNVEAYPDSWNVYDSLAEAYLVNGDKELAIKNYEKSLELNSDNDNAKRMLERLKNIFPDKQPS